MEVLRLPFVESCVQQLLPVALVSHFDGISQFGPIMPLFISCCAPFSLADLPWLHPNSLTMILSTNFCLFVSLLWDVALTVLQSKCAAMRTHNAMKKSWAIAGNERADDLAEQARTHLPPALTSVWQALCQHVAAADAMRDCIRAIILGVAFPGLGDKAHVDDMNDQKWDQRVRQAPVYSEDDLSLTPLPDSFELPPKHSLGKHAAVLFDWLCSLTTGEDLRPVWVCSHQLLVHFQGVTGLKGFRFNQRTNRWDEVTHTDATSWDFHKAASSFQAALKCLAVALGLPYKPIKKLPDGPVFRCWVNCLLVRISPTIFDRVNNLMKQRGAIAVQSVKKVMRNWTDFCGDLSWVLWCLSCVAEYRRSNSQLEGKGKCLETTINCFGLAPGALSWKWIVFFLLHGKKDQSSAQIQMCHACSRTIICNYIAVSWSIMFFRDPNGPAKNYILLFEGGYVWTDCFDARTHTRYISSHAPQSYIWFFIIFPRRFVSPSTCLGG